MNQHLSRSSMPGRGLLLLWSIMGIWRLQPLARAASVPAASGDDFTSWFPGFVESCVRLHDLLVPFSMALLVLAFAFSFWHGQSEPVEMFRFLIKLFVIVLLITHGHSLINDSQVLIQDFVDQNIPARPDNIAELYKAKLAEAQNAPELQEQNLMTLFFSASFFESLVLAAMTLISWFAMAVLFFVFIVQKVALLLCWSISPPLLALFAIRPLAYLAFAHSLRLVGITLWPIGIAIASSLSEGLLDNMVRGNFLDEIPVVGATGWALQQILSLTVIAIWVIFSSLAAPFFIQRLVAGSGGPAMLLTQGGDSITNLIGHISRNLVLSSRAQGNHSRSAPGSNPTAHSPVPAMPLDTPPPAPTELVQRFAPESDPSDPTAQRRVDEALAGAPRPI